MDGGSTSSTAETMQAGTMDGRKSWWRSAATRLAAYHAQVSRYYESLKRKRKGYMYVYITQLHKLRFYVSPLLAILPSFIYSFIHMSYSTHQTYICTCV